MHSIGIKLISELTQKSIDDIGNIVFKSKVIHPKKLNLAQEEMDVGTHAQIWKFKIDMGLRKPASKNCNP